MKELKLTRDQALAIADHIVDTLEILYDSEKILASYELGNDIIVEAEGVAKYRWSYEYECLAKASVSLTLTANDADNEYKVISPVDIEKAIENMIA